MAWDQQGYYQDPYQAQYQDPSQNWNQDQYQYYGYDPYADYGYYQEDPDAEKRRLEQEEKERIEVIESNRLYLKKIRKKCVKEDFVDLEKLQLFLFEVLIEYLEADSGSDLGLVADDHNSYITARVQFLNSPFLEICEKDTGTIRVSQAREAEYIQTIAEAGLQQAPQYTYEAPVESPHQEHQEREVKFVTKWENASGKSCLFSMTPLQIIQDLEHHPVNIQVARCTVAEGDSEMCEPLGYTCVRLPDEFSLSVLQSCKEGVILPVCSVHRETCEIKNVFGVKKGMIEVFVRLSCFGPVIITSFQRDGSDRQYTFKPSPMSSYFKEEKEEEHPRSEDLKPIITEEETTVGISVLKDEDIFQKPVLWKTGPLSCGCVNEGDCLCIKHLRQGSSHFTSRSSMKLPLSSEISLCRSIRPPTDYKTLKKFGKPLCDWHNLVGLEIKNSPGGNCGCIHSVEDMNKDKRGTLKSRVSKPPKRPEDSSRILKLQPPTLKTGPTGPEVKPEKSDCECDCPAIRDVLQSKKLFMI